MLDDVQTLPAIAEDDSGAATYLSLGAATEYGAWPDLGLARRADQVLELERTPVNVAMKEPSALSSQRIKGQTLRLSSQSWLKLKLLAALLDAKRGARVTQHDLLLEAVEDLLSKYRKDIPGTDG